MNECQKIRNLLSELRDCEGSSAKAKAISLVNEAENCLQDAAGTLKQMDIDVRTHTGSERKALDEKLTKYKTSLSSSKADFER